LTNFYIVITQELLTNFYIIIKEVFTDLYIVTTKHIQLTYIAIR